MFSLLWTPEDTPVVSAQDELDNPTKKRTETRTDNEVDIKSEAIPEMTADRIAEAKNTNVPPKASTSRIRKSTKTAKPTNSDSQINDMDASM